MSVDGHYLLGIYKTDEKYDRLEKALKELMEKLETLSITLFRD